MALAKQVEDSLKEAESNLRNALAFAARSERPIVNTVISELIQKIDCIISTDSLLDKLENRKTGDRGTWGSFFEND
jgi:hypothetical protein